jgi:hypothetical protein
MLVLQAATTSLNDEANVQSNVRCAIAGAELIEDQEAAKEHMSLEVLRWRFGM